MKVDILIHPLFVIIPLSLLLTLSPACGDHGKTGATTPAAGQDDREPSADPTPAEDPPGEVASPVKPAVTTVSSALPAEEQALLDHHNRVRADVSVAPLTWSDQLQGVAAAWGQKLVAKGCVMEHSKGSGYGENLYMGSAEHFTMVDAAKSWESEKKYFTGAPLSGSNWYRSGHYTQMVWRQTTEVGCAKVTCKGSLIVICNYNPPGNFMGQKAY